MSKIVELPSDSVRPLYRRVMTNRRLDILQRSVVRFIYVAALPFMAGYMLTRFSLYYTYEKPVKRMERKRLEREILYAELSGFNFSDD